MNRANSKAFQAYAGARHRARLLDVVTAVLVVAGGARAQSENPYEYDVSAFMRVPPELLRFEQVQKIPVDISEPAAIAVDGNDDILVAGDEALAALDAEGKERLRFPLDGAAHALAVAESGDILVGAVDHIDVYAPTGGLRESWVSLGEKALITSVAVGGGRVYIADAGTRVVWRFDAGGRLLGMIGASESGGANKHFVIPSPYFDVVATSEGGAWIVNPGEHLLEHYNADGTLVSSWGKTAMTVEGFCGCCNPVHIARMPDGSFVTSEKGIPRIKIHDANGVLTDVVAAPSLLAEGGPVPDPNLSCSVEGAGLDLAVTPDSRVLALDRHAGVIRVFRRKSP
jgi:hypothetical protein